MSGTTVPLPGGSLAGEPGGAALIDGLAVEKTVDVAVAPERGRAPYFPRRFATAPRAARRTEATGWRRFAEDAQVYSTKWFRQMLFVAMHPEEGFWELKRSGDWTSVLFVVALLIAARGLVMAVMGFHFVFFAIDNTVWSVEAVMEQISRTMTLGMTQFLYGGNPEDTSILQEGVRIIIPFVTWCLAHYAVAMIFFGEGSFRDICVSAAFCFGPYIVIAPIATFVLTNSMTLTERSLFMTISWGARLWVVYLFYTHIRVIHDFGTGRTLATYGIGAVTVIIIWALSALIFALSSNTYEFFYQVFYELTTR